MYVSPDAAGGIIALTQFEPMFARLVIPCFDEPQLKGRFAKLEWQRGAP